MNTISVSISLHGYPALLFGQIQLIIEHINEDRAEFEVVFKNWKERENIEI